MEHFFFHISKLFEQKYAIWCTKTPILCTFFAFFPIFSW